MNPGTCYLPFGGDGTSSISYTDQAARSFVWCARLVFTMSRPISAETASSCKTAFMLAMNRCRTVKRQNVMGLAGGRRSLRAPRLWAISVLHEAGAIRECESTDAGPRHSRRTPRSTLRPYDEQAVAEICDVLDSIGDARRPARPSSDLARAHQTSCRD
jgi:hypothetical protein